MTAEITQMKGTPATNIMYKTLGFMWLLETFYPASAFATADRDGSRKPQRFIHVTVGGKCNGRQHTNDN